MEIGQRVEHHDQRDQEVFSRSQSLSIVCTCRKHRRTVPFSRFTPEGHAAGKTVSDAPYLCSWYLFAVTDGITGQLINTR